MTKEKAAKEFHLLARNIRACVYLGLLVPLYAAFAMEKHGYPAAAVSMTLILSSAVHLVYLERLRRALSS